MLWKEPPSYGSECEKANATGGSADRLFGSGQFAGRQAIFALRIFSQPFVFGN